MNKNQTGSTYAVSTARFIGVGILTGFLLNLTGWLGNNFILGNMWGEVASLSTHPAWRSSIWRDVLSFLPDFIYGFAIVWLFLAIRTTTSSPLSKSVQAGLFVSMVGGITTYFAIANSGFIPWKLAFASFALVLITKVIFAIVAGKLLSATKS